MARARKTEERHLNQDEREMLGQSRAPVLCDLGHEELVSLARRLRERRDRARDLGRDRRRSASRSGQAAPADTGNQEKKAVLATAIKRVNKELERRRGAWRSRIAGDKAQQNLRAALKRRPAAPAWTALDLPNADEGMAPLPNRRIAPSGALHAEGARPAMMRAKMAR